MRRRGREIGLSEGTLQEAGAMLWRDGATRGYGPTMILSSPSIASCANSLLFGSLSPAPKGCLRTLGGFDALFEPAYYEDVDLCMRVQALGYK